MNSCHHLLFLPALFALVISGQPLPGRNACFGSILPGTLGDYRSVSPGNVSVMPPDRELLNEYGLRTVDSLEYVNPAGRRMGAEAYQFEASEGAYAAYLYLHPVGAVGSPLAQYSEVAGVFGQTRAVLAGSVTVVARNNYVFRFHGSAPSNRAMERMLDRLPGLDPSEPRMVNCCRYFVESSERILLGPVSLAKFAPRVPSAVAAFRLGVEGRVARFETPAGPMSKIVFEYASPAVAQERFNAFRTLPGARSRLVNRRVGVIFDAPNLEEADELLADIAFDGTAERSSISFDLSLMTHAPMTFDDAMASTFVAYVLGGLIAVLRFFRRGREGIPDRTIALRIAKGQF